MDKHLELANRAYEVVIASLTPLEAWGFYLTDSAFDREPELRNRLTTLWICSVLDVMEAELRFLPEIKREAEQNGFVILADNCIQLQKYCTLAGEFLDQFTREEQIFLMDIRNQWVHGYYAARHRNIIKVKVVTNGKLEVESLDIEDFRHIVRSFYEDGKTLDQALAPIREKALDRSQRYWAALSAFQKHRDRIYEILRTDQTLQITV